jgi:hypothetical protein
MCAYVPAGSGGGLSAVQLPLSQAAVVAPLPDGSIAASYGACPPSAGTDGSSSQPQPQQVDVRRGAVQLPDWAARRPSVVWLRVQAGGVPAPSLCCHAAPPPLSSNGSALRGTGCDPQLRWVYSRVYIAMRSVSGMPAMSCMFTYLLQPHGSMRRSWCESQRRAPGPPPPPQHPAGCCPTQAASQRSPSAMVHYPRQHPTYPATTRCS